MTSIRYSRATPFQCARKIMICLSGGLTCRCGTGRPPSFSPPGPGSRWITQLTDGLSGVRRRAMGPDEEDRCMDGTWLRCGVEDSQRRLGRRGVSGKPKLRVWPRAGLLGTGYTSGARPLARRASSRMPVRCSTDCMAPSNATRWRPDARVPSIDAQNSVYTGKAGQVTATGVQHSPRSRAQQLRRFATSVQTTSCWYMTSHKLWLHLSAT